MNFQELPITFYLLTAWSLIWKGLALWRSAKFHQRNWFVALLVLNTLGILEIVYLFKFATKKLSINEIQSWTSRTKDK